MFSVSATKLGNVVYDDDLYVRGDDIIKLFKDELLQVLTDPDKDELVSEYLKDRIALFEKAFPEWKAKNEVKNS